MKVCLTYEINEAELRYDCASIDDTNCYNSLDNAVDHIVSRISQGIANGFVVDEQSEGVYKAVTEKRDGRGLIRYTELFDAIKEDFKTGHYFSVVMFEGYQENWQCYYTIVIEEKELQ